MADVVTDFNVKLWNGTYYCTVRFPDNTSQELKSPTDLTYTQWQEKITAAWDAHNTPIPEPDECQCPACKKPFTCPNRR